MATDALDALQDELRATPPSGLSRLTAEQAENLAGAIREARHRQAAELAAAGDQALRHIPRLLRAPVRKVLGS